MPDMDSRNEDLSEWLSTYQWMTLGRLLSDYGFHFPDADVVELLSQKTSFYYQMMTIPMMNVLNGIILDQTKEYQLFLQKLFVDFLISGESDKTPEEPGSGTRKELDDERTRMIAYGKEFDQIVENHDNLIMHSQFDIHQFAILIMTRFQAIHDVLKHEIDSPKEWEPVALQTCFVDAQGFKVQLKGLARFEQRLGVALSDRARELLMNEFNDMGVQEKALDQIMEHYVNAIRDMRVALNGCRTTYYDWIAKVQALLFQAAPYQIDEAQDKINRERLSFDPRIGALE